MSVVIDIFEARSLTNAINKIPVTEPFVIANVFKNKVFHTADKIDIEIIKGADKLAKFVNPYEEANVVNKLTRVAQTVTLPRTYEKKIFTAYELGNLRALGQIYSTSAGESESLINGLILQELEELKNRVIRRREQMACEAIATGQITVTQSNITFNYDFGFVNNRNLLTLTGTSKWDSADSNPIVNLRNWKRDIMKRTGQNADILILGTSAADAFLSNAKVKAELDTINNRVGAVDLTQPASQMGIFIGNILGIRIYEYSQQYTKEDGTVADMIPANKAILVASGSDGFRLHYGPIYRIENGNLRIYQEDILAEPFTNEDRTTLEWKTEQKSLPAIHEPDAVISATVV